MLHVKIVRVADRVAVRFHRKSSNLVCITAGAVAIDFKGDLPGLSNAFQTMQGGTA